MSLGPSLDGMNDLPARTRYATVDAERSVAFAEADLEAPSGEQVVVRIRYTGVCATDTHGWASGGLIPAAVFGHEWTGTVVAAGDQVTTVAVAGLDTAFVLSAALVVLAAAGAFLVGPLRRAQLTKEAAND